jgi:AsmA protein
MQARIRIAVIALGATVLVLGGAIGIAAARVDPNAYKRAIVERVYEKTQRNLRIGGDIRLAWYPRLGVSLGKASLSERGGQGEFATLDSVRLSFAPLPLLLRQEIVVDRIELRGMRASVLRQPDGSTNIDDLTAARVKSAPPAGAAEKTGAATLRFAVDSIRVDNAHLRVDDRKAGRVVDIARLNIDSGPIAHGVPSRVALSANIGVDQPALNTVLIFESGFALDRDTRRVTMSGLDANLDLSSRSGIESRAKLKGSIEIDFGKETVLAALKGKIDDSAVSGKGTLRDGMLQLDLDIDRLDLARYRARSAVPAVQAAGAAAPEQPPEPSMLAALATLRASGTLQVGELSVGGLRAANVHAVLLAEAGKTSIKPLSATLYGGSGSGSLSIDFGGAGATPRMALVQDLRGIALGPLLLDATGKTPLSGRGDVQLDLETRGTSSAALRQALSGTAALRLREGAIGGIDLGRLVRDANAAAGVGGEADATSFGELSASFRIENGIAHNQDVSVSTALLRIGGEGQLDLAQETIDLRLRCTVLAPLAGQDSRAAAALAGLTVPVALNGPLARIGWQVDVATLASEAAHRMGTSIPHAGKEKSKDRGKDHAKDHAKDHSKDALGGLFPR